MPNQGNFPEKLTNRQHVRPSRIANDDLALIADQTPEGTPIERDVVFGQTLRDVVEVYVYDELNNIVAQINVRPDDPALRLLAFIPNEQAGVGQDQSPDVLQMDMVDILGRLNLPPGRYSLAINYLRDEVGQQEGGNETKLFIAGISPSRTEIRLQPVRATDEIVGDVREFVEPSVPHFVAQALIDQTFGVSLDPIQLTETITFPKFTTVLAGFDLAADTTGSSSVASRLTRAKLAGGFYADFDLSLKLIRDKALDLLAMKASDLQVQDRELRQIIEQATKQVLVEMVKVGYIDPRIQLIDSDGNAVTPTAEEQG